MKHPIVFLIFFTCLLFSHQSKLYAQVAIEFSKYSIGTDLDVHFTPYSIGSDETWHIAGGCSGARKNLTIYISEYSIGTDLDIHLTKYSIGADRTICITNPKDAPEAFWKIYNQL